MGKFVAWFRDHPLAVLTGVLVTSAFFSFHIKDLRVDTTTNGMMAEGDPRREIYQKSLDDFGSDNMTIVFIKDKELFNANTLGAVQEVFYSLQEMDGVDRVESLFNATNFKNEEDALSTSIFFDEIPDSQQEINQIHDDALNNPLVYRRLISRDGNGIAIGVFADPNPEDPEFNIHFSKEIDRVISRLEGKVDQFFQIGIPRVRKELSDNINADQVTIVPLAALVLLIFLVIFLRTPNGAVLPLLTGGLSSFWTLGFMAMVGIPVNVLTVIVPSLILVIGATEDMHIISEYYSGLEEGKKRKEAIRYVGQKVGLAILFTAATTFLGFLTTSANKIILLKEFGYAASFGLFVNFWVTMAVIPVYMRFFGDRKSPFKPTRVRERKAWSLFDRVTAYIILAVRDHRNFIIIISACVVVVSLIGASRIKVDNNFINYFKEDSDLHTGNNLLAKELSGGRNFNIVLRAKEKEAFKRPEYLKMLFDIQTEMRESRQYGSTTSIADYIALIHRELNGGKQSRYRIPENPAIIPQYFLFLEQSERERYVTSDFMTANIVVQHNIGSSYELKKKLKELRKKIENTVWEKLEFDITGEEIVINGAADSMSSGQAVSISILLFFIFIFMSFLFVNVKAGVISVVANGFPIVLLYGIMGWFEIPLNIGTALISSIALGIAVDDTVHFMVRYNLVMKRCSDAMRAIMLTIHSEVRPVFSTSVALAAGFFILSFSQFVPTIHFGILAGVVILIAFLTDVFITPLLCLSTQLVTLPDMLRLRFSEGMIERCPLFHGMSPWEIKKVVLLGRVRHYTKDHYIIHEGRLGRSMYLLLEGRVEVQVRNPNDHQKTVGHMTAGDVFGEIGFIGETRRTASVVSKGETRVLFVDWNSLESLRKVYPVVSSKLLLNISKILGDRLVKETQLRMENQGLMEGGVCLIQ